MAVNPAEKKKLDPEQLRLSGSVNANVGNVGQGRFGRGNDTVPPPPEHGFGKDGSGNAGALFSLYGFLISGKEVDTAARLVEVAQQMDDTTALGQKNQIKNEQQTQEAKEKAQEKKLKEAQEKLDEMKDKKHTGNILDALKCTFAWVAAALAVSVAVVVIASGAGAPIGALLIGAALCAVALAVDSTVSASTHKGGIAGNIALACGASKGEAGKADMGFQISVSALGAIFSVGAGAAGLLAAGKAAISAGINAAQVGEEASAGGTGAGMAGGTAAGEAGGAAGEAGGETGETVTMETIKQIGQAMKEAFLASMRESSDHIGQAARVAQRSAEAGQAASQVGSSATDVGKGAVQYESEGLQADAKRKEAESKAYQAEVEMLQAVIDKAIALLVDVGKRFAAILDSVSDSLQDKGNSLARVKFTG